MVERNAPKSPNPKNSSTSTANKMMERQRTPSKTEAEIIDTPMETATSNEVEITSAVRAETSVASTSNVLPDPIPIRKPQLKQDTLTVHRKLNFKQKEKIDQTLLQMITSDFQPLSVVEDAGFRAYSNALNPSYTLPSKKVLSNTLLPAKFIETYNKSKEMIKDAVSVTVTTDCWTSCNNESFIALTAHYIDSNFDIKNLLLEVSAYSHNHTSANLATEIRRIITDWGLDDSNILLAVSDNAANIKKAIKDELKWRFFGCLAHTINLIVQDALKCIEPLVTKVKDIVSYFRRSTVAKNKLSFYQKQNNQEPKNLIQSVSTRWNSVFFMFQRILEIKDEVRASLAALGKEDLPMLTNDEFDKLNEMVAILSPMEASTRSMSGEKYVTLSSVIIINNCLQDVYTNLQKQSFSATSKEVLNSIITGLNTRLKNLESSTTLLVSTFLDPRYKNVGFSSDAAANMAKEKVSNLLANFIAGHNNNEEKVQENQTSDNLTQTETDSLWNSFDKKAAAFVPTGTCKSRAIIELQRYIEEPLLPRHCDPLNWWKTHAYNYPNLSRVVREKFGTVATSVPCERVFSKTGELLSARRNRLGSEKVKQIMFINKNC
jgi:hypothetical protein